VTREILVDYSDSTKAAKYFKFAMPVRVVFRVRRAGNLIKTGEDNTPHGMTNKETITLQIEYDTVPEETIQEFCVRVTKTTIHGGYSHCAELCRTPHFIAAFSDYNLDDCRDSGNGFRIPGDSRACLYEGRTLVLCYTNHASDVGDGAEQHSARGESEGISARHILDQTLSKLHFF
jgi:hypothetical protein